MHNTYAFCIYEKLIRKIDRVKRMNMDPRGGWGFTPPRRHPNPHLRGGGWGFKPFITTVSPTPRAGVAWFTPPVPAGTR